MAGDDDTLPLAERAARQPEVAVERGVLVGPFIVIDRLGAGGMGVVASAFDPTLNRHVALKVVHPERAGRGELLREAQAMAQVAHPNVVTVYQVGELGGDGERASMRTLYVAGDEDQIRVLEGTNDRGMSRATVVKHESIIHDMRRFPGHSSRGLAGPHARPR